jgi:hypothetical protein
MNKKYMICLDLGRNYVINADSKEEAFQIMQKQLASIKLEENDVDISEAQDD